MSCFAGLLHLGGSRVEPSLLDPLLAAMRLRAPDGEARRSEGPVALGYLHLRTGSSGAEAMPPDMADEPLWVVADARIDGRRALTTRLREQGVTVADDAPPAVLIRLSYAVWGDALPEHLLGDFAFLLWDRARQHLLAARDAFGVRPLHYTRCGDLLAFASDADALLALPGVSRELDETSLADFLLFGSLQDPDRTSFRNVRCLPPASCLVAQDGQVATRRYWRLPPQARVRLRDREEYTQAFTACFEEAVADRLPQGPFAIQLSGGMDSSSIAAVAARRSREPRLAVNATYKSLMPDDQEGELAALVAEHLRMDFFQQDMGQHGLFERSGEAALRTATPVVYPKLGAYADSLAEVERFGARVLLSGHGGDALFAPSPGIWRHQHHPVRMVAEALHHLRLTGSLRGLGLRGFAAADSPAAFSPELPDWLEPWFAQRVDASGRWRQGWSTYNGGTDARHQLQAGWLTRYFETAEALKRPVQLRHPFYDRRLVELLLGFPDAMLARKAVLRAAMQGHLPPQILTRPKTGLAQNSLRIEVTNGKLIHIIEQWRGSLPPPIVRERYLMALDRYSHGPDSGSSWSNVPILSPLAYAIWAATNDQGVAE